MTANFERSPFRDTVLELIASAPADGTPISAVLALPGAGSRDGVDHLLARMVLAGEILRCGRGRYVVPGRRRAEKAVETAVASIERDAVVPVHQPRHVASAPTTRRRKCSPRSLA